MSVNKHEPSHTISVLVFVMLSFSAYAQKHTVSGYVRDAGNGESLIGATIFDVNQQTGTLANTYGFYSIATSNDSIKLSYSFVGYTGKTISFRIRRDTSIVVLLNSGRLLDEIVVSGLHEEKINETSRTGTVNLSPAIVSKIPAFAGEQDVLKAIQLIPGVSGGAEGSSNILVRGGTPDQTLILMDNVPIYNPTHLYGLFSTFNPDAVNNIELVKSGFPARYGGRLSGVADITLREGNANKYRGSATVGLLASRLLLEGPIVKGKTSFLVSGRTSYMNIMGGPIQRRTGNSFLSNYRFYDINAKVNHKINASNRVYTSFYKGADYAYSDYTYLGSEQLTDTTSRDIRYSTRQSIGWGNTLASIRWNHELSSKSFFNATAYLSDYQLEITDRYAFNTVLQPSRKVMDDVTSYNFSSTIRDIGLKVDFDYLPNARHYIRYGGALIRHRFVPGVGARYSQDPTFNVEPANFPATTSEVNAYIEDDFNVSSRLKANFGAHAVVYCVTGKTYGGIQPRFSIRYSLTKKLSAKASYSYMQQYLQTLTNGGLGLPIELWVPSTDIVKPQNSHQWSAGLAYASNNGIELSLEGFYKRMNNLIEYEEGASYLNQDAAWYTKIEKGIGRAYGLEVFLQKKTGKFNGFIGYTLAWNERKFDNINDGKWWYYRYDRRHEIKLTANYTFNKHFDLSSNFLVATGGAVTAPVSKYGINPSWWYIYGSPQNFLFTQFIPEYQSRGAYRMVPYHRLDINFSYNFHTKGLEHRASVGIYNAYNRRNPFFVQYVQDEVKAVSLFPFMPSVSYSIKF